MPNLSAILWVQDTAGERLDPPLPDGGHYPIALEIGPGIAATGRIVGGRAVVSLSIDGSTPLLVPDEEPTSPFEITGSDSGRPRVLYDGEARSLAVAWRPITPTQVTYSAHDADLIELDGSTSCTGIQLPSATGARGGFMVIVDVSTGPDIDVFHASGETIMGGGTYSQSAGSGAMYVGNGKGDAKRILFA